MLVEEAEKLINEGKIVACKISDLCTTRVVIKSSFEERYELWNDCKITGLENDMITFLYKIDDEHYVEYFTEKKVRIKYWNYWGFIKNKNEAIKELAEIYENCPFMIYGGDLIKISPDIKEVFRKFSLDKKRIAKSLNAFINVAKSLIETQKNEFCLEDDSNSFKDLEGKEVFIASINDLEDVILKVKDGDYNFAIEKKGIINTIPNLPYIVLTKISPSLYKEYYSDTKILIRDSFEIKTLLKPQNFNEFNNSYNFLLKYPLAISGKLKKFDNSCKHLLVPNHGKEGKIKELIEQIQEVATDNLESEYAKIVRIDEVDAYVANALVDMVLRLRKNTED